MEVSGAAKFTASVRVSEVAEAADMLFLWKGGLLQSGLGLEEAVTILIGERSGQTPIEKDGKLFLCRRWSTQSMVVVKSDQPLLI